MTRRVVITGLGTVNPIGLSVLEYWRGLLAGTSGIAPITHFDITPYKVKFGGEVKNFRPDPVIDARAVRRLDRFSQYALVATETPTFTISAALVLSGRSRLVW